MKLWIISLSLMFILVLTGCSSELENKAMERYSDCFESHAAKVCALENKEIYYFYYADGWSNGYFKCLSIDGFIDEESRYYPQNLTQYCKKVYLEGDLK